MGHALRTARTANGPARVGRAGLCGGRAGARRRAWLEPLCAYYAPTCIAAIERHLDIGDRRAIAFHDDVRVGRLNAVTVARFGDPARVFLNVNAPGDLLQADRWAASLP